MTKKSMTKADMSKVNGGTPHYTDWSGKKISLTQTTVAGAFSNSLSTWNPYAIDTNVPSTRMSAGNPIQEKYSPRSYGYCKTNGGVL